MVHNQIRAIAQTRQGQAHYSDVLKALAPAFFILSAVAALMVAIA